MESEVDSVHPSTKDGTRLRNPTADEQMRFNDPGDISKASHFRLATSDLDYAVRVPLEKFTRELDVRFTRQEQLLERLVAYTHEVKVSPQWSQDSHLQQAQNRENSVPIVPLPDVACEPTVPGSADSWCAVLPLYQETTSDVGPQESTLVNWASTHQGGVHSLMLPAENKAQDDPKKVKSSPAAIGKTTNTEDTAWKRKIRKMVKDTRKTLGSKQKKKATSFLTEYSKQMHATKDPLYRFVTSEVYDFGSSLLILSNCAFLAFTLQEQSKDAVVGMFKTKSELVKAIEITFALLFLLELLLRVGAHRRDFLRTQDWAWNIFDVVIVGVTCFEVCLEMASESGNFPIPLTMLRTLRAARTVRALRAVKVFRFFRELRMLLLSILGSMKSLMWSMMMLMLCWFVVGIVLVNGVLEFLYANTDGGKHNVGSDWWQGTEGLRGSFGTLDRSFLTLFMSMSGGVDWGDSYAMLVDLPTAYSVVFLFYITFTVFGLVNVVLGVFVENAMDASQSDREIQIKSQMQAQEKYLKDMHALFKELDIDGSGTVRLQEFERHLDDERALAYFEALKLDVNEVGVVFKLLDADGSDDLDAEEFIAGCQRLKGESRALDIAIVQFSLESFMDEFSTFREQTQEQLKAVSEQVSSTAKAKTYPLSRAVPKNNFVTGGAHHSVNGDNTAKTLD